MAIAYDSAFNSTQSLTADPITVSCTPVGTPRGVLCYIHGVTSGDQVSGVTYGGVAMTETADSPLLKATPELISTCAFLLGSSVPTGVQDCVVTRTGSNSMYVGVVLYTASTDIEVVDTGTVSADVGAGAGLSSNPNISLVLSSRTCAVAVGFGGGGSAVTAITPRASWTARGEYDHGSQVAGTYTYDTIGSSDVTAGWDQADDDASGLGIALSEIAASVPTITTTAISATTSTTASSGGNVSSDGGSSVTARGVCWNTTGTPTIANDKTSNGTGTGSFTSSITGLTGSTTYYVRAYATNTTGTGYGSELSFVTNSASDTMSTARVTSGVAPLFVAFDVFNDAGVDLPPVNGSGDVDPARWYYFWNFGDHGAGAWSTTNKSKNTATGMVAGHVFDKPGTYTTKLRVYDDDGAITTYQQDIVVQDPDDIFDADNTFFYSSSGNDSTGDGTIGNPYQTATKALGTGAGGAFAAAGPRRVRFKRGETFTKASTPSVTNLAGPFLIDSYGDDLAADPIINVADALQALTFDNTVTGVRVVDLDIRGPAVNFSLANPDFAGAGWTAGAGWAVGSGVATGTLAATDLEQDATGMTVGNSYEATYTVKSLTAGTVQLLLGTGAGTARSSVNAFTEAITNATDTVVRFRGAGFTGTIDDLFIVTNQPAIRIPNDSLFLRCSVDRFSSAFSVSDAHGLRTGTAIVECTLGSNLTSYGIYWALGYQSAILGNTITTNNIYNNEHLIRQYISHGVVQNNQLTGGGRGKTCMRMAGYYPPAGLTNDTFTGSATGWLEDDTDPVGTAWTYGSNAVTHVAGNTTPLTQTVVGGATGEPRPFTFSITAVSAGSVTITYGGTAGTPRSTVAAFSETIVPTSGALLEFVPSSDFDGTIDFVPTSSIEFMDTFAGEDEPTTWLEYTWITDNILAPSNNVAVTGGTLAGVGTPFMFGVTNSGDAQYARNCVVERNKITVGDGNQAAIESDAACYFTYRNNVIDMTADPGTTGIRIRRSAATSLTATGNQALNNSIICNASFSGTGISYGSGSIASAAADTVIRNTHLCKDGGAGAASASAGNETGTTVTDSATDTTTAGVLAMTIGDYRPSATSNAIGIGFDADAGAIAAQKYVRDAYDRITFLTTRDDAGAFEIGFTATTPATVGNAIGFNRDDCEYDSSDYCFVDLCQMSGNTSSPYGWDTVDATDPYGANAAEIWDIVDVEGWPTKVTIPFNGGDGNCVIEKRFRSPTTGAHTIYFDGAGTIQFSGACTTAEITTSGSTITVNTADTDIVCRILISNVATPVKNLKCIIPGHTLTYSTAPYYPTATSRMAAVTRSGTRTVFRAMNWRRTNGDKPEAASATAATDERPWSRRSTLLSHTQGGSFGVAWEHCARLCNTVGMDLWACIPHQADENYVRSLAQLLLGELDTDRYLWVELSNELWNASFDQKAYVDALGNTTGFSGASATVKGKKQRAKMSAEWFDIFLTEWGEANSGRLYFVLGAQGSNTPTIAEDYKDYYEEVTIDSIPVNPHQTKIHAFAIAPYFGSETTSGDRFGDDAVDEGWYLTDTASQGVARIPVNYIQRSNLGIEAHDDLINTPSTGYTNLTGTPFAGCIMVAYEGGQNAISSGANSGNSNLTTFLQGVFDHDNYGMVCTDYLTNWWANGGKLMCWFTLCGTRTGTNMYGALQHIDNTYVEDPAYAALIGQTSTRSGMSPVLMWAGARLGKVNRRPPIRKGIR